MTFEGIGAVVRLGVGEEDVPNTRPGWENGFGPAPGLDSVGSEEDLPQQLPILLYDRGGEGLMEGDERLMEGVGGGLVVLRGRSVRAEVVRVSIEWVADCQSASQIEVGMELLKRERS